MFPKQSSSPSHTIFVLLVACAFLLASCGAAKTIIPPNPTSVLASPTPLSVLSTPVSGLPSPVPQVFTATPQAPLATPVLPLDTATPVIADTPAPLNPAMVVVSPPPGITPAPTSMTGTFALITGTTAGVIQGTVQPHQVLAYTLGGGAAQPLTLIMESPNNDVTLGVFDPSNVALLDPARKLRAWQMILPATEQYTVQVIGGATTESFTLTIKLPQLVYFPSGATSTSLSGSTVNGYLFSYALNCAEGQTMTATLNQSPSTATLDIYGVDSGTILEASANVSQWSGVLPETQDYVIEVVPTNSQVVNFTLAVSCTGTPQTVYNPTVYPANNGTSGGGSIVFAPNTTAAVEQGTIYPGQLIAYTVQASQYQAMTIKVESTNKDVTLEVLDPSGALVFDPAKLYGNWQMVIYQTGLYTIKLVGGATTEAYTLTTKVAIQFTLPSTTHSITMYGTNHGGFIQSYGIKLSASDVLTVSLDVPATKAYLDIFGILTGAVLPFSNHATSWTGTLPATEEYVIEVIPTGGYLTSYGLTVSVP